MKGFNRIDSIKKKINNSNLIIRLSNLFSVFLYINLINLFGCSNFNKNEDINLCSSSTLPCLQSTEYVLLITNKGKIKLELYGKIAPITVGNFIENVENGLYDKTIFNRVIRQPYPFIIRGGDSRLTKVENTFKDNKIERIRYIPLEIKLKNRKLPIYGKKIEVVHKKNNIELKHKRASLAMARSKEVNSASLQFYISLKSTPELDGRYAVFGKVISGMNIVELIEEEDFIIKASRL